MLFNNPYTKLSNRYKKALQQYKKHGKLIIGVDFDYTLYDPERKKIYNDIQILLQLLQNNGHVLCCWTANKDEELVRSVWKQAELNIDYYNTSPALQGDTNKPHFNILLDDTAGLHESITILYTILNKDNW